MRFNKNLNERAKGHTYEELYESMLKEVQTIQRKFPNERSIPQDHEFWKKKEELFDLVEMLHNGTLDVIKPVIQEPKSTFRNRKAGTARDSEDKAPEVFDGIRNNS